MQRAAQPIIPPFACGAAAGIELRWDDFANLSKVVPLLARIYPNGSADVIISTRREWALSCVNC